MVRDLAILFIEAEVMSNSPALAPVATISSVPPDQTKVELRKVSAAPLGLSQENR